MISRPKCRIVQIHTFRGDRSKVFRQRLFKALDDEKNGRGPGPVLTDCLLFAGHTGVSTAEHSNLIYGFSPDSKSHPIWQVMQRLRNGGRMRGIVRNDATVFAAAEKRGLAILRFDLALSPRSFDRFQKKLKLGRSPFHYGFPDGDGDCNCTTWIERLGLPLLTGRMDEFTSVMGVVTQVRRRFGICT